MSEVNREQAITSNDQNIVEIVEQLAVGRVAPLKKARQATIAWALAHTEGNVQIAAEMLGTSSSTVYRCARRLGRRTTGPAENRTTSPPIGQTLPRAPSGPLRV